MAVEVGLCHTLMQWPYLTDMSLINAMVGIFVPTWCTGPPAFIDTLQTKLNPWLYFNCIVRQSQVCVHANTCAHKGRKCLYTNKSSVNAPPSHSLSQLVNRCCGCCNTCVPPNSPVMQIFLPVVSSHLQQVLHERHLSTDGQKAAEVILGWAELQEVRVSVILVTHWPCVSALCLQFCWSSRLESLWNVAMLTGVQEGCGLDGPHSKPKGWA